MNACCDICHSSVQIPPDGDSCHFCGLTICDPCQQQDETHSFSTCAICQKTCCWKLSKMTEEDVVCPERPPPSENGCAYCGR